MSSTVPAARIRPTETLEIGSDLSLSPRLKLFLTIHRSDPAVKPIDEWRLRQSLLDFLRSSLSLSVPDEDLVVRKRTDLSKRKRDEPVASGTLFVRNLGFLKPKDEESKTEGEDIERKRFLEWRSSLVDRLSGIELNIVGVKFQMTVEVPVSDDFERMKESWDSEFNSRNSSRRRPDTVIIEGIPSRWFAETRVSSKPSMLVTHTIFSALGAIRNLKVADDDELGKESAEKGEIVPGLQCKVWVQFESYDDFSNAMKVLCGRSMQKQGSRLKVDYEVTWDRDGFFRNLMQRTMRSNIQGRGGQLHLPEEPTRYQAPKQQSQLTHFNSDSAHPRRFRD